MWRIWCVLVAVGAVTLEESWTPAPEGGPDGTLLQVHILFRHGQRVPKSSYPTDPNKNASLWDDGVGQLTAKGRRQGYALGIGLRRRYQMLLPAIRAWKDIRTQSSQVTRTMMTAGTVLAGLIPSRGLDRWSELDWQPAPIITLPPELDNTLAGAMPCPKLKHLMSEPDHPSKEELKLRAYLQEKTGREVHSLNAVEKLYTCLYIENQVGLRLPNWTKTVFPEPMRTEAGRALGRSSSTLEMARLRAGPLWEELIGFDPNNIEEPIRLYATHDSVLTGLLGSIGLYSGKPPGFLSTVVLEYRMSEEEEVHVQIWYRDSAGRHLERLEWPGCGGSCPLEQLKDILSPLIPKNWKAECRLPVTWYIQPRDMGTGWWITLGFALSCSMLLIISIGHVSAKRKEYEILLPERLFK